MAENRERDRATSLGLIHERSQPKLHLQPPPPRKRLSLRKRLWVALLEKLNRAIP